MADPLKQMRDELGVCTEEALFYFEGFRWDLNAAMDACRSKTLPSLAADQPPSKKNERAAAEEQRGDEKIKRFVEATGATVEEARSADDACRSLSGHGLDQPEKKPEPVPVSGNEGSGLVQEVLSHVSPTNLSPPWTSTARFRLVQRSMNLFHDVLSSASVQDVTDCLNHCKGDVDAAIQYYYEKEKTKEKLMDSFSSTTGETLQVAKVYLELYKWDLGRAVDSYFTHIDSETQKSLEEAGEGDVTVADGKAAEETETVPAPFANRDRTSVETQAAPSTIVMTITLVDETSLELPFRSDQTVRDIHNAIDQRYPDKDRGYVLRSMDGVDYKDWNITVDRVSAGDSTFLLQVYP